MPKAFSYFAAFLLVLAATGCGQSRTNHGFCAIIPPELEAPLSYGTYRFLDKMPDQAFLEEEEHKDLRRIPPMEVRTDPAATEPVLEGRCAFSIFAGNLAEQTKGLSNLKSQTLAYADSTDGKEMEFRIYFNPQALPENDEAAHTWTQRYLTFLWTDDFQNKLSFYGLRSVSNDIQKQMEDLSEYLPGRLNSH